MPPVTVVLSLTLLTILLTVSPSIAWRPWPNMKHNSSEYIYGNSKKYEGSSEFVHMKYHMGPVLTANITVHPIWYGTWLKSAEEDHPRVHQLNLRRRVEAPLGRRLVEDRTAVHGPDWREHLPHGAVRPGEERPFLLPREVPHAPMLYNLMQKRIDLMNDLRCPSTLSLILSEPELVYASTWIRFLPIYKSHVTARSKPLPINPKGGLYLLLTSTDVYVQDFCGQVCGFHYFTFPSMVGYTLPYAWVGNSAKLCPGVCAYPFAVPQYMPGLKAVKSPNGDVGGGWHDKRDRPRDC
ncbi:hypothetical protein CUMW_281330 [Citrus unshiu]|uniref:Uncharacterized protein n=1 Tax=Citrus unshiu TaxID=55188 RepID=A0A2H5MX54_CITUN|nr:hypothetical protein CUMW_281330 [Citrus unshiu]